MEIKIMIDSPSHNKTNASLISIVQRISDITSIFFSGLIVAKICNFNHHSMLLIYALILLAIFQLIGGITDYYRSWRGVSFSQELRVTIINWVFTCFIAMAISVLFLIFNFSAEIYIGWAIVFLLLDFIGRLMIRMLAGYFRSMGYNKRVVAIAGAMPAGKNLAKMFDEQRWLGFEVYGHYCDRENKSGDDYNSYRGGLSDLVTDAKKGLIDRVYLSFNMNDTKKMDDLIKSLADTTCSVMLIPDIFTYNILHSRLEEINGIPVVPIFETPLSGLSKVIKRLEDIVLSFLIILFISPVLIVLSLAVKLTSSGPVLFRQKRYGIDGKSIKVYKFRTMIVMEDDKNIKQATKNDPRVTKLGSFLRKTSLDELPQFFNVLFGTMSIVGPRPHAVSHNERYRALISGYMLRHKVKPGITGWAQVNGWRGETDTLEKMEKRVEYDLYYIRNWSFFFDIKIIIITIFKGFVNKSAY